MTNVTFPRIEIEKHIKLTKENIEKISLFGTPLEKITKDEVEIEVFPNRPDLISMQGFLRGFKAFLGKETGLKTYKLHKPEKNYVVKVDSSVKEIRPYTVCAIVKNLELNNEKIKEIVEIQEKLHITIGRNRKKVAIGIYPLEKIKLPIKYTALSPEKIRFIPLDSEREMSANQILSRHPKGKEYAHLLNKEKLFPIFLDAKNKILSMPPIINSQDVGKVEQNTKDIFIECSGSDLKTLQKTLNILVTTFADMGGTIFQMNIKGTQKLISPDLTPEKIKISLDIINKLLGLNITESQLSKLLPKMGYYYSKGTIKIPAWRTDILHEVDIAEDVAIAYGYDKLIPNIPNIATIGEESKESIIKRKISEVLIGLGLVETSTYHLIKQQEAKLFRLEKPIELEDSKTEYKILRPNLLIPTLRIFSENKDHNYPQSIFELGTVFSLDESKSTGIKETENLIIASSPTNVTKIKQYLNHFSSSLGIQFKIENTNKKELIDGRCALIKFNDVEIGYFGEVHPLTLKEWRIKMPLSIIEISLDRIFHELEK